MILRVHRTGGFCNVILMPKEMGDSHAKGDGSMCHLCKGQAQDQELEDPGSPLLLHFLAL